MLVHITAQLDMVAPLVLFTETEFRSKILDPYCALWCVFLWELPQMRFTEKQLNKRLASHELMSIPVGLLLMHDSEAGGQ